MDRLVVLMMLFLLVNVFFFNILLSVFGFFFNIVLSVFGKILNGYLWGIVIFIISKYNIYY